MRRYLLSIVGAGLTTALTVAACGGGGGGTPTTPSPSPSPAPTPSPSPAPTATITISSGGSGGTVSPKTITVAPGTRVTFVNNNTRVHDMASDPHPAHTDCPELNQVGFLSPGQSRQSGNLNSVRTCTYHDHNRELDDNLQGTIIIRNP